MSDIDLNEAAARLRDDLLDTDKHVEGYTFVNAKDLRAILDAYAALRDERDGLILQLAGAQRRRDAFQRRAQMLEAEIERREAAEKVVNAVQEWEMYQDIEYSEALVEQMLRYKKRFGGRDDK